MATEPNGAYVMDLAVLLKALRDTQQTATQVTQQLQAAQQAAARVGQQLQQRLHAVQDLEGQMATALTQAVQQATAALTQAQEQTQARLAGETHRYHTTLAQQWQEVIAQAHRVQQWLPWKVATLLVLATLLLNVLMGYWWWTPQLTAHAVLQQYQALGIGLDRVLRDTLYVQLPAARQQELDAVYRAAQLPPPSKKPR